MRQFSKLLSVLLISLSTLSAQATSSGHHSKKKVTKKKYTHTNKKHNHKNKYYKKKKNNDKQGQALLYVGGTDGSLDGWNFAGTKSVYRSVDDGVTWNEVGKDVFPDIMRQCRATFFKGKFLVVGGSNNVYSTTDGEAWTKHAGVLPQVFREFDMVEYKGKLWVLGGYDGTTQVSNIFSSTDGINWVDSGISLPARIATASMTVFKGKIWLFGGQTNLGGAINSVYSFDGESLTDSLDPSIEDLPVNTTWSVAYTRGNTMFTTGGLNGDNIYSSTSGANWVDEKAVNGKAIPKVLWTADTAVYKGDIYLAGGLVAVTPQPEVYKSSNGVDWVKVGELPQPRAMGCLGRIQLKNKKKSDHDKKSCKDKDHGKHKHDCKQKYHGKHKHKHKH